MTVTTAAEKGGEPKPLIRCGLETIWHGRCQVSFVFPFLNMSTCPHCFESLPFVRDAYCPSCREPLREPGEQNAAKQDSATNPNVKQKFYPNPYLSPVTISRRSDVILYTELPSRCPSCDKKFSEVNFRRRFKRKILWSTFSYMLLVSIAGYVLVALLLPTILFWPTYLCIVIPVLGNAMTWPKMVKMSCLGCNWKKSYIVAGTGTKRK